MKIYISLPISGLNIARCEERANEVKRIIERKGHEAITPFDVCPDPDKPYSYYMGRDIEALLECDAILRCAGWSNSRGCSLESECAHIYHKKIFNHVNEIKPAKSKNMNLSN